MDFLKDPRFSQYRGSTTIKKYFPKGEFEQLSDKENLIYKLIKSSEPTVHQKNSILKDQEKTKQKERRKTIQVTNSRFLLNKTSQRLSSINSFFQNKKHVPQTNIRQPPIQQRTQGMRKEIIKLNQFTVSVERFQKSINRSKQKVSMLKSYNSMISNHFDRFQVNEDRTRKEIMEHEEIIKLLLSKNSEDDNVAYFNAVGEKKMKENSKGRAKSSGDRMQQQVSINSSLVLAEMSKINGYQGKCEQRVTHAIEQLRRNGMYTNVQLKRAHTEKVSIKDRSFGNKDSTKESRFCKQSKWKNSSSKENDIQKGQIRGRQFFKLNKIKKGSITRLKENVFNRQHSSFISTYECVKNQNDSLLRQTDQDPQKQQQKAGRHMQKRMKTAGPFEYSERNNMAEKLSGYRGC